MFLQDSEIRCMYKPMKEPCSAMDIVDRHSFHMTGLSGTDWRPLARESQFNLHFQFLYQIILIYASQANEIAQIQYKLSHQFNTFADAR